MKKDYQIWINGFYNYIKKHRMRWRIKYTKDGKQLTGMYKNYDGYYENDLNGYNK